MLEAKAAVGRGVERNDPHAMDEIGEAWVRVKGIEPGTMSPISEINPALPKGYAPVTIIGAFRVNGNGDATGWALVNAGGLQMTAEFVCGDRSRAATRPTR